MKLRHRLIASFCIIIFLPLVTAFAVIAALSGLHIGDENRYWWGGLEFSNSLQDVREYTDISFQEIIALAQVTPEVFLQEEDILVLNNRLQQNEAYLVVRYDGTVIFDGRPQFDYVDTKNLPAYGKAQSEATELIITSHIGDPYLLRQYDLFFPDGKKGSIFMVAKANTLLPSGRQMVWDLIFSVVLILAFTGAILIIWIYRGLFSHMRQLVRAAENIKEGNLSFSLEEEDGSDEMSVLTNTFEAMRARLQKDSLEKLEAENEQRQLISNIAHDLKTPLTSIQGYTEGILDGVANTPEKQKTYLKMINTKAKEMDILLNELTMYSQIDTNRIPYNFKHQNVHQFFEDCVEELRADLENRDCTVSFHNQVEPHVEMIADPEQLMRVILNITGNSMKYKTTRSVQLDLRVLDVGDFIQVELEDNGKGITSKDLPYIFDRMYRGDASRNAAVRGSGIGLAVAKKIIEDHGGQIWATSKVGVGTVIYFVLRKYGGDSR